MGLSIAQGAWMRQRLNGRRHRVASPGHWGPCRSALAKALHAKRASLTAALPHGMLVRLEMLICSFELRCHRLRRRYGSFPPMSCAAAHHHGAERGVMANDDGQNENVPLLAAVLEGLRASNEPNAGDAEALKGVAVRVLVASSLTAERPPMPEAGLQPLSFGRGIALRARYRGTLARLAATARGPNREYCVSWMEWRKRPAERAAAAVREVDDRRN